MVYGQPLRETEERVKLRLKWDFFYFVFYSFINFFCRSLCFARPGGRVKVRQCASVSHPQTAVSRRHEAAPELHPPPGAVGVVNIRQGTSSLIHKLCLFFYKNTAGWKLYC